jgi:hypothetical protein
MEYNVSVPEGDYEVRLGMPEDVQRKGFDIREIPFEIRGKPGAMPNKWSWFDKPTDDIEQIAKWNKRMTRNADAFGVQRGDFRKESWRGKVGILHIGKNGKTGYMEVQWAVLKAEAGTPAPIPTKPVTVITKQESFGAKNETPPDFPDDIPFN